MRLAERIAELREMLDPSTYDEGCPCSGEIGETTLCLEHNEQKLHKSALAIIEELQADNEKLKEFISYVMADVFQGNDIEGGGAQDEAERLGLLELRPIPEENSIDGETEHFFLKWDEEKP